MLAASPGERDNERPDLECRYLARPGAQSFERTYGWAWLLKLADEIALSADERARRWSRDVAPLAEAFVARYLDYLPKAHYPIRHGMHPNSAFGLMFALPAIPVPPRRATRPRRT